MSRKRVMCCGTFDYLHPGHLSFIAQAAALGDELYVVVARAANVQRIKGHLPAPRDDERRAQSYLLGHLYWAKLDHRVTGMK